jgi:hypothetical protein
MSDQRARAYAYHESGHAVVAELLGGHVRMITLGSRVARTWYQHPSSEVENAAIMWAGIVGETLVDGPLTPESWTRQPDFAYLRALPSHISNRGYEMAEALLLGDPDHAAQVAAVADALLRRRNIGGARRLGGWAVRSLMENPPQPELYDDLELGFA